MIEQISPVRRARVPVVDTPQDLELVTVPAPTVPTGSRSLSRGDDGLSGLRRPPSLGAAPAPSIPLALQGGAMNPGDSSPDPALQDSHWRLRSPLPVARPEPQPLAQNKGAEGWETQVVISRCTAGGEEDRLALSRAVATLDALPHVVFDERSIIAQRFPRAAPDAPVVSAGLALEWLLAGPAFNDPAERLRRLGNADGAEGLALGLELVQGLRRLDSALLKVGSVVRVADRDLTLQLDLLMGMETGVMDAAVRDLTDMLQTSTRSVHLLVLTGGPLPQPVACIRESDAQYSVFDPSCGVFVVANEDLQAVIRGVAARYEQQQLESQEGDELDGALTVLQNARLLEVTIHGEDVDDDGDRDGGLI